jgi:Ca-activated chloride channel family protein
VSFASPHFLWLFVLVLGLSLWAIRGQRLRARSWRLLAQRGKVPNLRSLSLLLAAVFLIVALARPRFGSLIGPPLPPGHDVALLIDVSRSMGAEDAVPNRLAVAIDAAESLVGALAPDPANRAAVVVFAGRGVVRYPLTENLGAVVDVLHRLQPGTVRPGGTDLGAGLDAALETLGQEEHAAGRSIVVFSDGEDLADHWRSRLDRLVRAGVIVHVVAIGDPEQGHPVPSGTGDQPISYQGEKVLSRRIDTALEAIAQETDGAVLKLGLAAADLKTLYLTRIAPVALRKRAAGRFAERPERFPLFLAAALGLALSGCWPGGRIGPWRWAWNRVAGAVLLGSLAMTGIGAGPGQENGSPPADPGPAGTQAISHAAPVGVSSGTSSAALVARGEAAYLAGQFTEALAMFESAIERAPGQPIPRYNAAATLFQLQRYEEARQRYEEARDQANAALRTKIDYALGNTVLVLGDVAGAVEHYDNCLGSTAAGTGLDAVRRDAAINRRFALEQAPPSIARQGESDRDQSPSKKRNRAPGARKPGEVGSGPTADDSSGTGPQPDGANSQGESDSRPVRGRRRTGGGGGASNVPPGSPGESPDDRLDNALDQIRDAQRRRLPEDSPAESSGDGRKDW